MIKKLTSRLQQVRERTLRWAGERAAVSRLKARAAVTRLVRRDAGSSPEIYHIWDSRPLTNKNRLNARQRASRLEQLKQSGIRVVPYPFHACVSITSDNDSSASIDYRAYTELLSHEFGLDFGDSIRVYYSSPRNETDEEDPVNPSAFFEHDGSFAQSLQHDETPELSFLELLRDFHLGRLDHFHGISRLGPRVAVTLKHPATIDGSLRIPIAPHMENVRLRMGNKAYRFQSRSVPVTAIAIQPEEGPIPCGAEVVVLLKGKGKGIARRGHPASTEPQRRFQPRFSESGPVPSIYYLASEDGSPPPLREVLAVEIRIGGARRPIRVRQVYLLSTYGPQVTRMLSLLSGPFGVRTNLLTDHGSRLYLNFNCEALHGAANVELLRRSPVAGYYCRAERDATRFSCLGDDPESICYVHGHFRDDYGLRFVNPSGISGEAQQGLELLNLVVPAMARDGKPFYVARRMLPALPDELRNSKLSRDCGTRSFPARLSQVIDSVASVEHAAWPIYTHLGNLRPKTDRSDPYFPRDVLSRLQDRAFNISGSITPAERIWFSRPTNLYDYALMLRSIGSHVSRTGADTIRIHSWHDPVLGRRLPISAAQLHGLTFYVDNADKARVFLDDAELTDLVRNPADETGRASVTLVGADIRHVVFDDLDPDVSTDEGLHWNWLEEPRLAFRGQAFARIKIAAAGRRAAALHASRRLAPIGCQYFAWAVRPDGPGVKAGFLIETTTGGTFYFGDAMELEEPATASYLFPAAEPGRWTFRIAPFYDLKWSADSSPGGPLPSHEIRGIRLLVDGQPGQSTDVDRVEFLRPSTTTDALTQPNVVLGGQVLGATPAMTATLVWEDDRNNTIRREAAIDAQGMFVFTDIPRGTVAELSCSTPEKLDRPVCQRLIEVWSNDLSLILEASPPA